MKGLIALDIDGTITHEHHDVPLHVVDYFKMLHSEGFVFAFVTGRTFSWGYQVLKGLNIPYHLCVNNGAVILSMPERAIESRNYIHIATLPAAEEICREEGTDFVVYTGFEGKDQCYYRPDKMTKTLKDYLEKRSAKINESWKPVESFEGLSLPSIASIKCFGGKKQMHAISVKMERSLNLHMPVIKDPHDASHYVAQATHPNATKGASIIFLKKSFPSCSIVIAAGDDVNDMTMLKEADISVVMESAPDEVRAIADIIAPPASEEGILEGLAKAIEMSKNLKKNKNT